MARNVWLVPVAWLGFALAARTALARVRHTDLHHNVVLITGGSRGLGLALAREFARAGCKIVLTARDSEELERARLDIESLGAKVMAEPCDVTDRDQVRKLVQRAIDQFGRIDVLINNAGAMSVGPLDMTAVDDFEQAMNVMFWGMLYPTFEVLPAMRARRSGHIVNITSIGGKLSVPHLMPYSSAKFAAVGFSEGLHAEVARDGVHVLTVVPGLMRTGSHVNAEFRGEPHKEFTWFSLAASLPITSISAEAAARQIVKAIERGESEIVLTWQASLGMRLHGLMPGLMTDVFALVDRLLPRAGGGAGQRRTGDASRTSISDSPLTTLGERAADDLNQRRRSQTGV
jgi:short-subunit dehydrogenase